MAVLSACGEPQAEHPVLGFADFGTLLVAAGAVRGRDPAVAS
jgi:hypothetical protein